jgi:Ca-activated chloride channel family protein
MSIVALLTLSVLAQVPQERAAFSSRTELAVLHVSVLDRQAGFVPGLPREAFTVEENGRPQPIAFFENDDAPVTVGLVIDNSGSMQPRRDAVIAATMAFASSSHPADEMFTINFNERVWPGLPPGRAFTSDLSELREALGRSRARGQTALFDGIDTALRHLARGQKPRKVLVVISDGGDNASTATFSDILDAALRTDVVIYTIGLHDPNDRDAKPRLLRELAEVTGGEAFFPRDNESVTAVLERIARDIRASYTIGYAPPSAAPDTRRKIKVDVKTQDRRKLKVRVRSTYVGAGGTK